MKSLYLFFFILYLLAPHDHKKEASKESLENIKKVKRNVLSTIFTETKFKKNTNIKRPETLTNWNYFINILNELLKNLNTSIVTSPSEKKENFYKNLTIFLDEITCFFLWEKDGETELQNINCNKIVFPKNQERANWQTKDHFIESTEDIFEHIEKILPLFEQYTLIENNSTILKKYLKIQLQFNETKINL